MELFNIIATLKLDDSDFNRGIAVVGRDICTNGGSTTLYGLIDNTGNFILDFQDEYIFIGGFVDGYAVVRRRSTGNFGVVRLSPPRVISVFSIQRYLTFDQPPIIEDRRTLVPVREILSSLQMSVDWDEDTQTVTARGSLFIDGTHQSLEI